MRQDRETIMEQFYKASREALKLSAALCAFYPENDLSDAERKELLTYLNGRKRPAVMELIRQGDVPRLCRAKEQGFLEEKYLKEYIGEAAGLGQTEVWAWLHVAHGQASPQKNRPCEQVLDLMKRRLRMRVPGFYKALEIMEYEESDSITGIGSDGVKLFYHPEQMTDLFLENTPLLQRRLLHLLLHQLYFHPVLARERAERLWNLACDISVERLLDQWQIQGLEREGFDERRKLLQDLGLPRQPRSAVWLYEKLQEMTLEKQTLETLEEAFIQDDHTPWQDAGLESLKRWQGISKDLHFGEGGEPQKAGLTAGDTVEDVELHTRKQEFDYRRFLERFMVCQEETELDLDSFDYLPYWYSRQHYDKIVMIEPLEYKDIHKLEELVIAIDTSGSCSGAVVRRFLEETWQILTDQGSFFQKMNVHLIQCDSVVQEHRIITSREAFFEYMDHIKIRGMGGTDFRPVFQLVDRMLAEKQLVNLKGLLYFTDGDGIFPEQAPEYDTAFIFLNDRYEKHEIPPWGIRLNLGLKMEDIHP